MEEPDGLAPRILPWSPGWGHDRVIARLSAVPTHMLVSLTGGCAGMSRRDGERATDLFRGAFKGFNGAMVYGGTRMIRNNDPDDVLFGITELGPAIRRDNPLSFVLGVVPRCEEFRYHDDLPVIQVKQEHDPDDEVDEDAGRFMTIVHPDQDWVIAALARKHLAPGKKIWHDEIEYRRQLTYRMRKDALWQSLLVVYNGGGASEDEIMIHAKAGWPVLIVKGSGRRCDKLGTDREFLERYPNVHVCDMTVPSMRFQLERLAVLPRKTVRRHLRAV